MTERFQRAFGHIQAGEDRKERTKAFLLRETRGYTRRRRAAAALAVAACCLAMLVFGTGWVYFTPTAEISIDVNPSLSLEVNRFDKVISVSGKNQDGEELAQSLSVLHLNYEEAIRAVLANDAVAALLAEDGVMAIGVIGGSEAQSARMLTGVENCTRGESNTYCYCAHSDEAEAAEELGLSYGKYQAFLELQALDPSVTVQEVREMSMKEIRTLLDRLSGGEDPETGGAHSHGGHGSGGSGQGHGKGAGG